MKGNSKPKRTASPEEVMRLAEKVDWQDVKLPSGDVVPASTIRELLKDAGRGLKRVRATKRAHATAA